MFNWLSDIFKSTPEPDWQRTNNTRWHTVKEAGDYVLQHNQTEYVDMNSSEVRWFDSIRYMEGYPYRSDDCVRLIKKSEVELQ